jgi:hypothetical protein
MINESIGSIISEGEFLTSHHLPMDLLCNRLAIGPMRAQHDGEVLDRRVLLSDLSLCCPSLDGEAEGQETIALRNSTNSSWNYDYVDHPRLHRFFSVRQRSNFLFSEQGFSAHVLPPRKGVMFIERATSKRFFLQRSETAPGLLTVAARHCAPLERGSCS